MGTPQAQMASAIANILGRVGRFAVLVGVGGSVAQTALYTGDACLSCLPGMIAAVRLCATPLPSTLLWMLPTLLT
jgi:hypothetical protein